MKMIAGAFFSASSNALRRLLSDSPASFDMISGPLIKKKKAPVSLATALAMSVFPAARVSKDDFQLQLCMQYHMEYQGGVKHHIRQIMKLLQCITYEDSLWKEEMVQKPVRPACQLMRWA